MKVSDHVYVIMGVPERWHYRWEIIATLVVDTGLGPRNGALVAREAAKLAKNPTLYLTTRTFIRSTRPVKAVFRLARF